MAAWATRFVAIDEGVIERERVRPRCSLAGRRGVKVDVIEGRAGLRDDGFECGQVAKTCGAAAAVDHGSVQGNDLAERQIPHHAKRRYSSRFFSTTRAATA
jgi:hypothetical protein